MLFAGISKGGFGSGAAFGAVPLLALVMAPGAVAGLMLPLLMLMDIGGLVAWWRRWNGRVARALLVGALPGWRRARRCSGSPRPMRCG